MQCWRVSNNVIQCNPCVKQCNPLTQAVTKIFFQAFFSQLLKLRSNCEDLSSIWSFIRNSNICFIYLHSFIHPSRVYYELTIWPALSWLDSSVGRELHRHRRGHGFESRSSLIFFFRLSFRNCEDLSSIWTGSNRYKVRIKASFVYLAKRTF